MIDATMRFDASKGFDTPAGLRTRTRLTGEFANQARQMVAVMPRADLERNFRQQISGSMTSAEVKDVAWKATPPTTPSRSPSSGAADLVWRRNPDVGMLEYRVSSSQQRGAGLSAARRAQPRRAVRGAVPDRHRAITEMVLPAGGKGFTVRVPSGEEMIGGMELKCSPTSATGSRVSPPTCAP